MFARRISRRLLPPQGLRLSAAVGRQFSISQVNNNKMTIEKPKESDFEEWQRLFELYFQFYGTTKPMEVHKSIWKRIMDPNGDVKALVARDDETGKLVGLAHYLWMGTPWSEQPICNLNDLYVDTTIRGKGYGKQLILAVKEAAKEHGCFRLRWVTKFDNPARKLYDSLASTEFVEYRTPIE